MVGEGDYREFLATKVMQAPAVGLSVDPSEVNDFLFPFQRDLTVWALRKGRAAVFADTGLGKTFIQVEWARLTGERTLIVAPLSVARQTVREAKKIGVPVHYTRSGTDIADGISITNYEMVEEFDPSQFGAVVLDESSILKALDGKTRRKLTEMFSQTRFRLCCTATPAPNDIAEIANHAEFLVIMSRAEMMSAFFVHKADEAARAGWQLKGHAEVPFFRWLASWGMSVRKPSDLGYDDDGFILPPLEISPLWVDAEVVQEGKLFHTGLDGISGRIAVRKATAEDRCAAAAVLAEQDGQWIFWCGLNDEANALAKSIPEAVNVQGSDSSERKAEVFEAFQDGEVRVLITKPKIGGFGMNFQNCHQMAFVGLSDSWESYYQCIRRCWRFGQTEPVTVRIVISRPEAEIYENVMRKEEKARFMADRLIANVREFEKEEIAGVSNDFEYREDETTGEGWRMMLGDSVERMAEIKDQSVHLSVFSPPFQSLYTYSPTERDLGNSKTGEEFFDHFRYIIDHLLRVTVPGRLCAVHVSQVPLTVVHDGVIGIRDFRGDVIRAFSGQGWIYHGEVCIDKDPQAQAVRTHSKGLLFVQLRKDSSWLRPAFADYIVLFRKPGDNPIPVHADITNDQWIEWARPIWYGIRESDTLNSRLATTEKDERHICPLQLGTIERCIRLWSNPGETILSPFAGIGSEGYQALMFGRSFVGIELKPEYYAIAVSNLRQAEVAAKQGTLFEVASEAPKG